MLFPVASAITLFRKLTIRGENTKLKGRLMQDYVDMPPLIPLEHAGTQVVHFIRGKSDIESFWIAVTFRWRAASGRFVCFTVVNPPVFAGGVTSHLKNTSNAQLRCYEPLQNAHILHVCCAFSSARALSLNVICIFEMACSESVIISKICSNFA